MKIKYVADDGEQFDCEEECIYYEALCDLESKLKKLTIPAHDYEKDDVIKFIVNNIDEVVEIIKEYSDKLSKELKKMEV